MFEVARRPFILAIQALFLLFGLESANSFVLVPQRGSSTITSSALHVASPDFMLPHQASLHLISQPSSSILLSVDWVELSKTIGTTMLGVALFFTALTYFTVNVLIPQATKEVEQQVKDLDPSLWDEYLEKLKPGETMAQRPDLVLELGNKVLELQDKRFDTIQESKSTASPKTVADENTIEVEVVRSNQWDD